MSITKTTYFPVQGQSPIVLQGVPQSIELVGDITGDKGTNEVWEDTKKIEDFEVKITTLDEYSTGVPHKVVKRVDTLNTTSKEWTEGTQEIYEAQEEEFTLSYKGHERDFEVKIDSEESKAFIKYRWGRNDAHDLTVEKSITITERPIPSEGGEEDGGESDILMFDTMPTGPYDSPTTFFAIHKKYVDEDGYINGNSASCMACTKKDSCGNSSELNSFLSSHEDYVGYCTEYSDTILDPTKFRAVVNIGPETLEWLDNDVVFSDSVLEAVRLGDGDSDGWIPMGFDLGDLTPSEDAKFYITARLTYEDNLANVFSTAYTCEGGCADCPWDVEAIRGTLPSNKVYICQQESSIPDDGYVIFLIKCSQFGECPEGWVKATITHQNGYLDDFWVCPVRGHISKDAIFPKS